ncbi:hypothetical protein IRJ41_020220, partial [Triplophysa rosa]
KENSVLSLKEYPFQRRSDEEKKRIKELGPDRPNLQIQQQSSDRGRSYTRCFSGTSYGKRSWLAGCDVSHAFYCFPCLLFQSLGTETLWTTTGVCDLKHLSDKNSLHSLVNQSSEGASQPKRRRLLSPEVHERIATEVCDTILQHTMERFCFTSHLVSATLLQADRFEQYTVAFPEDALSRTLKAYPVLNGSKLKTELSLIYCKEEFRTCCGAVDLLQLFKENNLEEVFSETVTLLKILITTPMTTAEAERCFSTLKRVKTFLRNSMTQERLNALAMLSMEKRMVTEIIDFNQKVIEKFASQKERRAKFIFK